MSAPLRWANTPSLGFAPVAAPRRLHSQLEGLRVSGKFHKRHRFMSKRKTEESCNSIRTKRESHWNTRRGDFLSWGFGRHSLLLSQTPGRTLHSSFPLWLRYSEGAAFPHRLPHSLHWTYYFTPKFGSSPLCRFICCFRSQAGWALR